MALKKKTLNEVTKAMNRFVAFLRYRSIGPHACTKAELKDLVRSGMITATKAPKTSVLRAYAKTNSAMVGMGPMPRATSEGAVDFLERMFGRYTDKAAQQFTNDLLGQVEAHLMPFADRREGAAVYDLIRDKDKHKKYLGNALEGVVDNWRNRWKMIVNTELSRASNYGAMDAILHNNKGASPDDITVWKVGPHDALTCGGKHGDKNPGCWEFWFLEDGLTPRVYKMSELMGNGTNIGKKRSDWKATVDNTHPNCFTEGKTPVLTDSGWKAIRDVRIGEKVLTHTGQFKDVIGVINSPYRYKQNYKITFRYLEKEQTVRVTPDHKFLTQRGWVEAKDLLVSDKMTRLAVPCLICENQVGYMKIKNPRTNKFKLAKVCSDECFGELMKKTTQNHHDTMTEEKKLIRASNCSSGTSEHYKKSGKQSPFAMGYWTEEKRQEASKRCAEMRKKCAATRVSKEQKLAFGWLKGFFQKNIELEKPVGNYSIDIAFTEEKIGIEIDGRFHSGERLKTDEKRDSWLREQGWTILRFGFGRDKSVSKANVIGGVQAILDNHTGRYSFEETEIVSIEKGETGATGRVFCLTVQDDESFIARGVVSHNCRHLLQELKSGFGFKGGKLEWIGKDHDEYKKQRG